MIRSSTRDPLSTLTIKIFRIIHKIQSKISLDRDLERNDNKSFLCSALMSPKSIRINSWSRRQIKNSCPCVYIDRPRDPNTINIYCFCPRASADTQMTQSWTNCSLTYSFSNRGHEHVGSRANFGRRSASPNILTNECSGHFCTHEVVGTIHP